MENETKKQPEIKQEEKKAEPKVDAKSEKIDEKKQEKKIEVKKTKKDYAMVNGLGLPISTKVGAHICDSIRYKNIDKAIEYLEQVAAGKKAVKMNNREVGHRHDAGMMAGRYPVDASKEFLKLLRHLKANAIYNELELETSIISQAVCNKAAAPYKRGGGKAKRSHLMLMLGKNTKLAVKENKKSDNKSGKLNHKKPEVS